MKLKTMHLIGAVASLAGAVFVAVFSINTAAVLICALLAGFNIGAWIEAYAFQGRIKRDANEIINRMLLTDLDEFDEFQKRKYQK